MSNALSEASVTVQSGTTGGLGEGVDNLLVFGCSTSGTTEPRFISGANAELDTYGQGDTVDFVSHYISTVRKSVCQVRLPSTVAGAVQIVDKDAVAGTSVVTATGTPNRRVHLLFEVVTGGTIGATGIEFRYSVNGGIDWSQTQQLGTATSWTVPNCSFALAFAAGTLIAADLVQVHTTAPKWDDSDFAAAIASVIELEQTFRCAIIIGEFTKADALTLQTQIDTLYAGLKRPVFLIAARDWYRDAKMTGKPSDVDFDGTGDTITRNTGSWIADGFKVGMTVTVAGSTSNNGSLGALTNVTATVLTFASGLTTEANVNGSSLTITAEETEATWIASVLADYAGFEDTKGRIAIGTGYARQTSQIFKARLRVPGVHGILERYMSHDLQISPNRKAEGKLSDVSLKDDNGLVVEHDARLADTLHLAGFLTLRSYSGSDGAFCGKPFTKAPTGSAFQILPWVCVANLMADIVQSATEEFIGDDPETNDDGTLTDEERERYNDFVTGQLEAELLSPKLEGPRASAVAWAASADDNLNNPDGILHGEGTLRTRGLIGSVATTVIVNQVAEG